MNGIPSLRNFKISRIEIYITAHNLRLIRKYSLDDINLSFCASVSGMNSPGLVISVEPSSPEQMDTRRGHVRVRHCATVV